MKLVHYSAVPNTCAWASKSGVEGTQRRHAKKARKEGTQRRTQRRYAKKACKEGTQSRYAKNACKEGIQRRHAKKVRKETRKRKEVNFLTKWSNLRLTMAKAYLAQGLLLPEAVAEFNTFRQTYCEQHFKKTAVANYFLDVSFKLDTIFWIKFSCRY